MRPNETIALTLALAVVFFRCSFIHGEPIQESDTTIIDNKNNDGRHLLQWEGGKKGGKGGSHDKRGRSRSRKKGAHQVKRETVRQYVDLGKHIAPDDLGIRFSKVTFDGPPPINVNSVMPLTAADFPPNRQLTWFLRQSRCISVVDPRDCDECDIPTKELIHAIGGYPNHASRNSASSFWVEFREVLRRQVQRRNGADPTIVLPIPKVWKKSGLSLEQVAEYVHDELPGTHHHDMLRLFIGQGFTVNKDMIPSPSKTEFLRREVMLSAMTTWAIEKVGAQNFAIKYHVGRARPEEIAWLIAQGKLTTADGVPSDIVKDVEKMKLKSQFDFTAYGEGSPAHPSWPAMHSAGSASALWVPLILNLNEEQICQTKLVDWAVSYARTVAGVHYISDNIAGLNLGQEILARILPDYLHKTYGVDPRLVRLRIRRLRFDWKDFPDSDCYKNNIGVPLPKA